MVPATHGSTPSSSQPMRSDAEVGRATQFLFSPAGDANEVRQRGNSYAAVHIVTPSPRWVSPGDADGRMRVQSMGNFVERGWLTPKMASNRVGINIDVPHSEHPYLIGPDGKKCRSLTEMYKALVHFPDTNRRLYGPRLNTVFISGSLRCVEDMRKAIRDRSPIRVCLQMDQLRDAKELLGRIEKHPSEKIRINHFRDGPLQVELKTDWRHEKELVQFCAELIDPANPRSQQVYVIKIELLPLLNPWNAELTSRLVAWMRRTLGCQLSCPDKDGFAERAPVFEIRGASLMNLLLAARFLYGLTMFQLSFTLPVSAMPITQERVDYWRSKFLVHTQIEPTFDESPPQVPRPSVPPPRLCGYKVTLRSFEFLIAYVYRVRASILRLMDPQVVLPEYNFMESLFPSVITADVFDQAKLFYPLYDIAGGGAVDYNAEANYSPKEFFSHFHGGPHSSRSLTQRVDDELTKELRNAISLDADEELTAMLRKLVKIDDPPSTPAMKRDDGENGDAKS